MHRDRCLPPKIIHVAAAAFIGFTLLLQSLAFAQTAKASHPPGKANLQSVPKPQAVRQELVRIETGFFEAWKTKNLDYFRDHIAPNGIFWGEYGIASREQQLDAQAGSAKVCAVERYVLSDFSLLPLARRAYLLAYKAEQHATCNGEAVPVQMNGSSIYILEGGRWLAIYRAEVPSKSAS